MAIWYENSWSSLYITLQSGNVTKYGHEYCLGTVRKWSTTQSISSPNIDRFSFFSPAHSVENVSWELHRQTFFSTYTCKHSSHSLDFSTLLNIVEKISMELSQTVALNGNMVRKFLSTLNFTLQYVAVRKRYKIWPWILFRNCQEVSNYSARIISAIEQTFLKSNISYNWVIEWSPTEQESCAIAKMTARCALYK